MNQQLEAILEKEIEHLPEIKARTVREVIQIMTRLGITDYYGNPQKSNSSNPTTTKARVRAIKAAQYSLIWLQWSRRYNVSLQTVVTTVVKEFRKRFHQSGSNLGVRIEMLTSPRTEQWFASVAKNFPKPETFTVFPIKYNSLEERLRLAEEGHYRNKYGERLRNFRGSKNWNRPELDPVRKAF